MGQWKVVFLKFIFLAATSLLTRKVFERKGIVYGNVVGLKKGTIYDLENAEPGQRITITVFGKNLWPNVFSRIWLTNADRCEDSLKLNKKVIDATVINEYSYENVLVIQLNSGIPEGDGELYQLCTQPDISSNKHRIPKITPKRSNPLPVPLPTMAAGLVLMIALSALFSGLNLSYTSVAINELIILIQMGDAFQSRLAYNILPIRRHLNWLICTFAMANAIINCLISLAFEKLLLFITNGKISFAMLTAVPCLVILIFGELLPLAICNRRGLVIASNTRHIIWIFLILLSPIAWPLSKILDALIGFQGCEVYDRSKIEYLIMQSARSSSAIFSEILKNAINLPRIRVGNVMTKIDEAYVLSTNDKFDDKLILSIVEKGYTRIPVYEGTKRGKIIAILNVKDLITATLNNNVAVIDLLRKLNYLKQVRFVIEEMHVKPLMIEMEGQNSEVELRGFNLSHLAMVVKFDSKSYSVVGLVTHDDIIEEIFGEIKDEEFQWTNRRTGLHKDQATIDFLRFATSPVDPLDEIYRIQEALDNYPIFKKLGFNVLTLLRLIRQRCKLHYEDQNDGKFYLCTKDESTKSAIIILKGDAYCIENGEQVPASADDLGNRFLESIYNCFFTFGTDVDISELVFKPSRDVLIKTPFAYVRLTSHALQHAVCRIRGEDPGRAIIQVNEPLRSAEVVMSTQSLSMHTEYKVHESKRSNSTRSSATGNSQSTENPSITL